MPWRTVLPLAVVALALGSLFGSAEVTTVAFAEEHDIPGVEREGTLRVIRFSNDRQILNDKGTVVGFAAIVARTGEIPPTHERALDIVPLAALQEHAVDVPADPGDL